MGTSAQLEFDKPIVELEKQIDELKRLAGGQQLDVDEEIAPLEKKLVELREEIYRNLTRGDIERRHYPRGAVIFEEGDDAHGEAYLVHAGTIEIVKRSAGGDRRLNLVKEGELLGEIGLFRHAPRSAAAIAVTDAELLVMRNERLEWLIRNRPELTLELLKWLSDQIVSRDS